MKRNKFYLCIQICEPPKVCNKTVNLKTSKPYNQLDIPKEINLKMINFSINYLSALKTTSFL